MMAGLCFSLLFLRRCRSETRTDYLSTASSSIAIIQRSTKRGAMPRSEMGWNEHQARLKSGAALARFLDLELSGVADFRKTYPDFLPSIVWHSYGPRADSKPGNYPTWLLMQSRLQEVWRKGFPEKEVLDLISSSSILLDFARDYAADDSPVSESVSLDTYRKAILFLYGESWRAKEPCTQCGRHFIASHSQSKFCSVDCSGEWRKQYKAARHIRIKKKLNAKRRREYAKRRGA